MAKKMTEAEYAEAREQYYGVCLTCGALRECTEPDAEGYPCDVCEEKTVQGIENALLAGNIELVDE